MRGPSAEAAGDRGQLVARACATSSSAAIPGRARRAITFSPWQTSARFTPVSGITSQTVASATRSSSASRSGSGRAAKKPSPAQRAHRRHRGQERDRRRAQHASGPDVQSSRFGLTVASTAGGGPSALWWSSTITSARPRTARQRLGRRGAAIDADDQRCAPRRQRAAAPARSARSPRSSDRARGACTAQPRPRSKPTISARAARAVHVVVAEHRRPSRRARTASASRSAAASMSASSDGSGSSARSVGSRKCAASSMPMPRAASSRPTISGTPARWAMPSATRSSPVAPHPASPATGCGRRRAPRRGRPRGQGRRPGLGREVVVRLDVAHRAGLAAHDDRMRRSRRRRSGARRAAWRPVVTPVAANITSPFAISVTVYLCLGSVTPIDRARADLRVILVQQPSLHLPADAAQRGGGEHALGRAARAHIDVDLGYPASPSRSRPPRRRR